MEREDADLVKVVSCDFDTTKKQRFLCSSVLDMRPL